MNTTKMHITAPIHNNLFISQIPLSTKISSETQTQINTTNESTENFSVNSSIPLPQHQQRIRRFFKKDIQPKTENFSESGPIYTPSTNHQENPINRTSDKKIEIQRGSQSTSNSRNENIQNQQQHFQRMEGYGIPDNELDELLYDNYDYSSDELYNSHDRRQPQPTPIRSFYQSDSSDIIFEYNDGDDGSPHEQKSLWNEYEISYSDKKDELCCSICFCSYDVGEKAVKLGCGHVFHENCISLWVNKKRFSPTCPICRQKIKK